MYETITQKFPDLSKFSFLDWLERHDWKFNYLEWESTQNEKYIFSLRNRYLLIIEKKSPTKSDIYISDTKYNQEEILFCSSQLFELIYTQAYSALK